jgi:hypothetical protein
VAAWAPGARLGKGRARVALLPPASCFLGCLAERWWLRPAALGLRLPGTGPRNHCSGAGKAAPGPAAGGDAAAEAPGGRWDPASAASPVRGGRVARGGGRRPAGLAPGPRVIDSGRSLPFQSSHADSREVTGRTFDPSGFQGHQPGPPNSLDGQVSTPTLIRRCRGICTLH